MRIIPHKHPFHLGRLLLYSIALLAIYSLDLHKLMSESICFWYNTYGFLCPTCGGTRSFLHFMHFNFVQAFHYNSALTLGLYPLAAFLVCQDSVSIILNCFFGKKLPSLLLFFMNLFNRREI